MCRLISLACVIEKVSAGTGSYGTYGTGMPYRYLIIGWLKTTLPLLSEKHRAVMSQEQRITVHVNALSRGV